MDILIKPAELILLTTYLQDLENSTTNGETDFTFYKRWKGQIETITSIATRLDSFLETKDAQLAQQVEYSRRVDFQANEYTVYKKHIPYYLTGIKTYQQEEEAELIHNGLFDKRIQEMTGLEFKTLLMQILAEYRQQKN